MKKLIASMVLLLVAVLLIAGSGVSLASESDAAGTSKPGPTVTVVNPVAIIDQNTKVVIMGAGFEPGQEVRILISAWAEGWTLTDLGYSLDPEPVANDLGAWATVWTCERLASKKMLKEGVYTLRVTDNEYNTLAYAPVAFYDAKKPPEEWPSWAK